MGVYTLGVKNTPCANVKYNMTMCDNFCENDTQININLLRPGGGRVRTRSRRC